MLSTKSDLEILRDMLAAAGLDPASARFHQGTAAQPIPVEQSHMLSDTSRILALTPTQRIQELGNVAQFLAVAKRS